MACSSTAYYIATQSALQCTPVQAVPRASLATALQLLRRAKRQGLQPAEPTYRALLRLCALSGRGRTALRLHKVPQALLI
jgi:hypothetical protein